MKNVFKEHNNELIDNDLEEKQKTQSVNVLTGKDFKKTNQKS